MSMDFEHMDEVQKDHLHLAAQDGKLDEVKRLVHDGFPVSRFDDIGKTPLHYAVENGHLDVARFLIGAGADVNAHDETKIGNTPLRDIAGTCSLPTAKFLLEAGADPAIKGWMQLSAIDLASRRKSGDGPAIHRLLTEHKYVDRFRPR